MILSKRLQCIADLVPVGSRVVDVGTDHAYIPLWLLEHGVSEYVIASDIKEGPLEKAKNNALREGTREGIRFVLAPGLAGCEAEEVDCILIAGMGGETIIEILTAAPWAREKHLVLQPQTKLPQLRRWLNDNAYDVIDARLVYDSGRLYQVWQVVAGARRGLTAFELLLEPSLVAKADPLLPVYVDQLVKKLHIRIQGLEKAASGDDRELEECRSCLAYLLDMRKENEHG